MSEPRSGTPKPARPYPPGHFLEPVRAWMPGFKSRLCDPKDPLSVVVSETVRLANAAREPAGR